MKYYLLLIILVAFIGSGCAQDSQDSHNFEDVVFSTTDDLQISGSFGKPDDSEGPIPAIILIHQGGSSRAEWLEIDLPQSLVENGYAVLAYDVRIHGTSGKDQGDLIDLFDNPERSPLDLLAAIEFLELNDDIDNSAIGIVGASIGANLACVASALDKYKIASIVSMSAKVSAIQNLSGTNESLTFANAFYIASEKEQGGQRKLWAEDLYEMTTGERALKIARGEAHGSYILREQPELQDDILDWFNKTL